MPNPMLGRVPPEAMPDNMRNAHAQSMKLRGDATFFEIFGNHPNLYNWYVDSFYRDLFRGGAVDRRIKEMVRYRMSLTHGCRFCNQGNRKDALEAGLTDADIIAVEDFENSSLDERDKLALRLADQMVLTNPDGTLTEELHGQMRAHFSDAEILELGLVMGILAGVAKFLFAFDLVEKEDNCPF